MTRLLVANDFSEDARSDRGWTGWWVQRLVWFAQDGDVLVLPTAPDEDFFAYATRLTGVDRPSLRVVVPPQEPGASGTLAPGRLADPVFLAALRAALGSRPVSEVLPLWPDAAVARLARALGAEEALPGAGFLSQAGGMLVNSKAMFRAVAGGSGVPVPEGAVCTSREAALRTIVELLDDEAPLIVKHEFLSGGRGNEILSTGGSFRPIGARRVVRLTDRAAVAAYLADTWDWLSSGGRSRPVVERYHRDSAAYFSEFLVGDATIRPTGDGELLSAPYAIGQVMPPVGLADDLLAALRAQGRRLAVPLQGLGYRGYVSADAIVTPEREVLFTEYNGRVTGSTHIYDRIGRLVVGPGYGTDRMILERVWPETWAVPDFRTALRALTESGLAYDPATRTGVVFTNAHDGRSGVMYCVVAEHPDAAWDCDRRLGDVFGDKVRAPGA
ncbi:peptide ligase PGM1-related protein [Streptomyces sp. NPDC002677]|uniref:preATP grasp domain-containing protein n=1 Tax=Streptomyces sp. NPDC002677 TaxID=3154774 RepID=UPI0033230048